VGEGACQASLPLILRGLAGESIVIDTTILHRNGKARAGEVGDIPRVETDGSIVGIHVLVFDVDERMPGARALRIVRLTG